jgi:hypothetical protein
MVTRAAQTRGSTAPFPHQRSAALSRQPRRTERAAEPPLDGLGQVTALVRDGFAGLRRPLASPRRTALWVLWLIGIVGDATTSLAMIRGGPFEEGNPLAAVGMGSLGMTGYVLLSSAVCLLLAAVSTGRPAGPVARAAVGFLLLVATGKVFMVLSNILLWRSTTGS